LTWRPEKHTLFITSGVGGDYDFWLERTTGMTKLDFTPAQIEFLAALDALQGPVSIKIVGAIAPLSPSELLELLRRGKKLKLIYEPGQDIFGLSNDLPQYLLKKFQEINNKKKIDALFRRLLKLNLWEEIPLPIRANLLARSGNEKDAALIFIEIADQSLENEKKDAAYDNLLSAINILPPYLGTNETDILFVKACLQLCHLCYFFGRLLGSLPQTLKIAIKSAEQLGDKRSKALLNFHLGFYHFTFGSTSEALQNLEAGRLIFEELGDEDMLSQSAGFIGLYYFIQGLNKEALEMFEKAELYFNSNTGFLYGPIFMAYSAAYSGHFDRAIGCLDYYWHLAQRMGREPISASYRATLGVFLLATFKLDAAKLHLSSALESAYASNNEFAAFSAETGLAFYYYKSNNLSMAIKYLNLVYSRMAKSRITILTMEPWQLQMVYDAEKQGYKPPSEFRCHQLIERLMKEKNVHLRGISLRLKAKDLADAGEPQERITKLLYESESCLKAASDPIQLAKTQLEIAKLKLNDGNINEARLLAMKARLSLSGHWEDLFPDDLRFLLDKGNHVGSTTHFGDSFIEDFIEMLSKLPNHYDIDRSLSNILAFTNRVFRAERGAILWVDSMPKKALKPKALKNMSASDLYAESFRANMAAIIKCQGENLPILINNKCMKPKSSHLVPLSAICLPITINQICHGVLYHDNTYLENSFELLSKKTLSLVSVHLEQYFRRCFEFNKAIEKTKKIVAREAILTGISGDNELVASCQPMINLLDQADKVAATESTVLIQGETGVGKELLARRIHKMSPRASAPFITIDSTTIPDNLVESELFGHEKGAFTGADRQKIGRVELADKGTLFIDEIGELPKSTQAKLLRVLQEKTFIRVGGTLPISSDFRLVVATNRNLVDEVKQKNFREDLFYRLNTVPLMLPPLRERDNDIVELAQYFLNRFSLKYQRHNLSITPEGEKRLCLYHWPGNIRELAHVIERSVILSQGDQLELNIISSPKPMPIDETSELVTLDELNRRYILQVLKKTGGKIYGDGAAAQILGINRGTLYSRMKKLGIKGY
jgi:transcriptional regulator with GAF, ATPase, and Fis domain